MKRLTTTLLATLAMAALTACVDTVPSGTSPEKAEAAGLPPAGYDQETWVSPNGCSYMRAKAFDWAPTWHLIINGSRIGLTDGNASKNCATVLYEKTGGKPHH